MGEKKGENFNLDKRFVYGLLIVAAIVAIYFFAFDTTTSKVDLEEDLADEIDKVRARVNGLSVYDSEVKRIQEVYGLQTGQFVPDERALEQAISNSVIIQEADKRGIEVSREEAELKLAIVAESQGLSIEEIQAAYLQQGKDFEEALEDYVTQLRIERLASEVVADISDVDDAEASVYYEENKELIAPSTDGGYATYDEVSVQLKEVLTQQKKQDAFNSYLDELRTNAEIEILQ